MGLNTISQIRFEKGYIINNSNQKVEYLIKNWDWLNNPSEITYKKTEISEEKTASIKTIREFGIYNISKYIKVSVNIDRSNNHLLSKIDYSKEPKFKEEVVFLKTLVEGKSNLYSYTDGNLIRFFFKKDNLKIEPLVFKRYKNSENKISTNNKYKQQLWLNLKCENITYNSFKHIDYKEADLILFFKNYSKCKNFKYINFKKINNKSLFNLNLRVGINNATLSTGNTINKSKKRYPDFGNELSLRLGVEAEIILPFNKNKWSIIIEPTYQTFKSEANNSNLLADYNSIELPIGIRHYIHLNNESKFFANGSFIIDYSNGKVIGLDVKSGFNLGFGVGYKKNDKYSVELRYHTNRNLFYNYLNVYSNYKTMSLIFSYTLF